VRVTRHVIKRRMCERPIMSRRIGTLNAGRPIPPTDGD
jgi:hypothetical protein